MNQLPSCMRETSTGIVLSVKVQPGASREECVGLQAKALKIRVTAPPVDSAANKALIKFLSKKIRIPKSHIAITKGGRSCHKQILLAGLKPSDLAPFFLKPCVSQCHVDGLGKTSLALTPSPDCGES